MIPEEALAYDTQMTVVPPNSAEAEMAFLGCILIDPDSINRIDIRPDEFYIERNRIIFDAIKKIVARHSTPDIVTLTSELTSMGYIDIVGGTSYLIQIVTGTPSAINIQSYAGIIRDMCRRRLTIKVASQLVRVALSNDSIVEGALSLTNNLTLGFEVGHEIKSFQELVSELYDDVVIRAQNPQDIFGIPTGFIDLDKYLGGLEGGTLFYLAGKPGIGKTKLAHQIGLQMAMPKQGSHPGAIFSMEMPNRATVRRAVSWLAKIGTRQLKQGKLTDDDWTNLVKLVDSSNFPVYIDDSPRQSVESMWAKIANLKTKYGIEWAVVDYLLLMEGPGHDETERSTYISAGLKAISREFDLAILAINSVTKEEMDNGRARMGGMRGSGQAIHDADLVAFLLAHQPEEGAKPNSDLVTLAFTKVRDIEIGLSSIDLFAHKNYPMFSDVSYQPQDVFGFPF